MRSTAEIYELPFSTRRSQMVAIFRALVSKASWHNSLSRLEAVPSFLNRVKGVFCFLTE